MITHVVWAAIAALMLAGCSSGNIVQSKLGLDRATTRSGGYYALPRAYFPLTVTRAAGKLTVTMDTPTYVPDPTRVYAIDYLNDGSSSDALTVQTDSQGLLMAVETTSKDQTGEIGKKFVELALAAAKVAVDAFVPEITTVEPAKRKCVDASATYFFDPAQTTIEAAALTDSLESLCVTVAIASMPGWPGPQQGGGGKPASGGIVFPPARPYGVTVHDVKGGVDYRFIAVAPDPDHAISIDLKRRSPAKLDVKLTFTNGMLTKFQSTDESRAVALLQIPIDILTAVAAAPGQLLTFRVAYAQQEAGYLAQQTTILNNQAALAAAIKTTAEAQAAAAAAKAK